MNYDGKAIQDRYNQIMRTETIDSYNVVIGLDIDGDVMHYSTHGIDNPESARQTVDIFNQLEKDMDCRRLAVVNCHENYLGHIFEGTVVIEITKVNPKPSTVPPCEFPSLLHWPE